MQNGGRGPQSRVIMHLDMDAFFVNVELLARPELQGQRIIVARNSPRSVVLSASYEARQFGVGSAMPLAQALRRCPGAVLIEPSARYRDYSAHVMGILRDVTDRVEQVSVDEAFVDLTGAMRAQGNPVELAQGVRARIVDELHLPSSAGISSTKFVAKVASTGSKPNGLWVVPPRRIQEFLDPLPIEKLWGVGAKSAQNLHGFGIHTVAQLREYELGWLQGRLGKAAGSHLYEMARGIDRREVVPYRHEKSIGAEHTFVTDQTDASAIAAELYTLCLTVARRLRASGKQPRGLSLKIRYSDFETLTRSCPLDTPTTSGRALYRAVHSHLQRLGLLDAQGASPRPIRLVGVRAERLESKDAGVQLSLFEQEGAGGDPVGLTTVRSDASAENLGEPDSLREHWERAEAAMDQIHSKFGSRGLLPARLLNPTMQKSG
ncbi:hypothetical protein A7979_02705 [Rothia nasimurium]|uniref:DNA polymerase IV n=1 Tax=Rothia nasimurium TaxID=85336 RepID=A0A1Y1RQ26_9MICC|nr:DNA polymerase IV [Rothia nasimurium]ORC18959.1 hypothetical protein A7979_02705 [Rothia nasimurium]